MMIRDGSIQANMPLSFHLHPRPHEDLARQTLPLSSPVIICATKQLEEFETRRKSLDGHFNGLLLNNNNEDEDHIINNNSNKKKNKKTKSVNNNDLLLHTTSCEDNKNSLKSLNEQRASKIDSSSDINNKNNLIEMATNGDALASFYLGGKMAGNAGSSDQLDTHTRHVILTNGQQDNKPIREKRWNELSFLHLTYFFH